MIKFKNYNELVGKAILWCMFDPNCGRDTYKELFTRDFDPSARWKDCAEELLEELIRSYIYRLLLTEKNKDVKDENEWDDPHSPEIQEIIDSVLP